MMAGITRILTFICVAGCHLSLASPVLHSALVVQPGQNVSLACNLTSSVELTWYLLRSDQLLPLLTVTSTKLRDIAVTFHDADTSHFHSNGDMDRGPFTLEILEVKEEDAGLYFCTSRYAGSIYVNRGIHLLVGRVDGPAAGQPCLSLVICVLPALLVLCLVFIAGFCLRSGKPAVCRCNPARGNTSQRVTEEVSLHYSSLKHADQSRPSGRGGTGLVEDNITYSAVTSRKNPNGSQDHR